MQIAVYFIKYREYSWNLFSYEYEIFDSKPNNFVYNIENSKQSQMSSLIVQKPIFVEF